MRYTKEKLMQLMAERDFHVSTGTEIVREISENRIEFTHKNGMTQYAYNKCGSNLYEPCYI